MIIFQQLRADSLWNNFQVFLFHTSHSSLPYNASFFMSLLLLVFVFFLVIIFILIFRLIFNIARALKEPSVIIQLIPPAYTEKTAYTTTQLFSVIHRLGKDKTFLERVLGRKTRFSFEIVST